MDRSLSGISRAGRLQPAVAQADIDRHRCRCRARGAISGMSTEDARPLFLPPASGKVLAFLGVTHRLTSEQSDGSIYMFELTFEPRTGNRLHVHSREDEIAYVLEGALEVRLRDRTVMVEAGGMSRLPKTVPHAIRNPPRRALALPVPGRSRRARSMVRCPCRRERRWLTRRPPIRRARRRVRYRVAREVDRLRTPRQNCRGQAAPTSPCMPPQPGGHHRRPGPIRWTKTRSATRAYHP